MSPSSIESESAKSIVLVGIPFDAYSSFRSGAHKAPAAIRQELHCESGNLTTEGGIDLSREGCFLDRGDWQIHDDPTEDLFASASEVLNEGHRLLSLGGDHSISYPLIRAHADRYGPLTVVQFDAHPDLYDEFEGNPFSHACPFARAIEGGHVQRLVQIGIRTANAHQREQAERFGVETVAANRLDSHPLSDLSGPIYLSLDLDVLDPAFAPGISHREPGGLSTRQLLDLLAQVPREVIGADLVELNPDRDVDGLTARVAAKVLKELLALMVESRSYANSVKL